MFALEFCHPFLLVLFGEFCVLSLLPGIGHCLGYALLIFIAFSDGGGALYIIHCCDVLNLGVSSHVDVLILVS